MYKYILLCVSTKILLKKLHHLNSWFHCSQIIRAHTSALKNHSEKTLPSLLGHTWWTQGCALNSRAWQSMWLHLVFHEHCGHKLLPRGTQPVYPVASLPGYWTTLTDGALKQHHITYQISIQEVKLRTHNHVHYIYFASWQWFANAPCLINHEIF